MDTLTHALSGALSARATAASQQTSTGLPLRRRIAIGFVVAALPDLDVLATWISPLSYLYHHRGVTHSLLMLPVWTLLLALLCSKAIWRKGPDWRAYAGVIALALGAHIAGDWITSFGTMVFAPLSDRRYALGTTFIIDLWFTGIIVAGLLASLLWRRTRIPAVAAGVALIGYVGLVQTYARHLALDFAAGYANERGLDGATITASPRPVSPFNWTSIVDNGKEVHYAHVNVVRRTLKTLSADAGLFERLDAPYRPLALAEWQVMPRFGNGQQAMLAKEVWTQPALGFFRWFAQHPVLYRVDQGKDEFCAWFQDLRFVTPGRDEVPFRYGLCRNSSGPWQAFQLLEERVRQPLH